MKIVRILTLAIILTLSGCIAQQGSHITMTGEYTGHGDALYRGCMAGLAAQAKRQERRITSVTIQLNAVLCEEVRRRFDKDNVIKPLQKKVF